METIAVYVFVMAVPLVIISISTSGRVRGFFLLLFGSALAWNLMHWFLISGARVGQGHGHSAVRFQIARGTQHGAVNRGLVRAGTPARPWCHRRGEPTMGPLPPRRQPALACPCCACRGRREVLPLRITMREADR